MLSEQIAALVQYGISSGLLPECEKIYTTNLLLDLFGEEAYQIIDHVEYIGKLHEIEDYFVVEKQYVIPLLTQNSVVLVQDGIEGLWLTVGGSPIVYNISVK